VAPEFLTRADEIPARQADRAEDGGEIDLGRSQQAPGEEVVASALEQVLGLAQLTAPQQAVAAPQPDGEDAQQRSPAVGELAQLVPRGHRLAEVGEEER